MAPSGGGALVAALRPRQWTKNLLLPVPLVFARAAFQPRLALLALGGFIAFCLLASAVYVLNDWMDREADRLHPEKRHRPIASGSLGGIGALFLGGLCLGAGAAVGAWVGTPFLQVAAGYLLLQVLYTFALKHWVIVDVMAIAAGFVLRVVAGGAAVNVPISNWLLLCTLLLAVFLGFAKRRAEISELSEAGQGVPAALGGHRASLAEYSLPLLDQMMAAVSAACILAYGLYTVAPETVAHVGTDRLKYTVPFVLYGIFRYLYLVHQKGAGGSPERVLLSDPPLLIDLGLYVAVALAALYR